MTIKQKINIEREIKFKINPILTKLELENFLKNLSLVIKEQISQKDVYWDNQACDIINLKRGLRVRYVSDQIKDVEFKSLFKGEGGQYVIEEIKLFKKGYFDTSSLKDILVNRLEICEAKNFNNDDLDLPEVYLSKLGLMPVVTLRKKRSVWIDQGGKVEISVDIVSVLGTFIEVEQTGKTGQVFDFIVKELENSGFATRDITHGGYLDLILNKNNKIISKSEFERRFVENNMWNVKAGEKSIFFIINTMSYLEQGHHIDLDFTKRRRRTGRKEEKRKGKLPNQIRHDENAAIAVGTWKKRSNKKDRRKESGS